MGRVLGERDGTGPDDHPLMRFLRDKSRAEGEREARARMAPQILCSRGLEVSEGFPAGAAAFAASSDESIAAAALACGSERDFLTRLGPARGG